MIDSKYFYYILCITLVIIIITLSHPIANTITAIIIITNKLFSLNAIIGDLDTTRST